MIIFPEYEILSFIELQQRPEVYRYYLSLSNQDIRDWRVFDAGDYEIIIISGGLKNTGGHWIEIVEVLNVGNKTVIKIREHQPSPEAFVTMAFTNPTVVMKMKKADIFSDKEIISWDGMEFLKSNGLAY